MTHIEFSRTRRLLSLLLAGRLLESRFSRLTRKAYMIECPVYVEGGKPPGSWEYGDMANKKIAQMIAAITKLASGHFRKPLQVGDLQVD